ncbi:MAG: tRNA pseudouridine(38-40) synthase TruA [Bryobacterales bacterium]|nr:tRNA pseudouridine(38-40) synthase TruA [Bryobacterales bacterium]
MRRIRITLAYDGTDFHGWQAQPGLPTVQGTVEAAFAEIEGRAVPVAASGRTDAGVHALAQVAAVSLENPIPLPNLRRALNRLLPPSIRILEVEEAEPDFHPRYQAAAKHYEYRVWRSEVCPPFDWRYVHHHPYPLDTERMLALAPLLEGENDFTAFAASDESDRLGGSKVRTIFSSRLALEAEKLVYRVCGSGFLKHMVRNIAGTLLEAGKGNLDAGGLRELLRPGCGRKAGPAAPAKGLFLIRVEYGAGPRVAGTSECSEGPES